MTHRTAAQIIAAADAHCRDGLHQPASDDSQLDQLVLALEVAVERGDRERGRELLKQIKQLEATN